MEEFKQSLLQQLVSDDWQQLQVIQSKNAWWAMEHWVIESTREQWATQVYLNFLVDPVWDAPPPPNQAIKLVTATATLPRSEQEAVNAIAKIDHQRSVDKQVMPFIFSLNTYRRTQCIDI